MSGTSTLDERRHHVEDSKLDKLKYKAASKIQAAVSSISQDAANENLDQEPPQAAYGEPTSDLSDLTDRIKSQHQSDRSIAAKTKRLAREAKFALTHPRQSAKTRVKHLAAEKLSSVQKEHSLPTAYLDLLRAQGTYTGTENGSLVPGQYFDEIDEDGDDNEENGRNPYGYRNSVQAKKLEEERDKVLVSWHMKHIRRVRTVTNNRLRYKPRESFLVESEDGRTTNTEWEKWLGHNLLYYTQDFSPQYIDDFPELPFDKNAVRHHAERFIMASGPWQIWFMDIRSVYRWEDPVRTARWLALYLALWYKEHIMGFFFAFVICYVVRNRFFPTSLRHLRQSIMRTADREATAFQLGEVIDRVGRDQWLDEVTEKLGPYVQLQLADLANVLEVLAKDVSAAVRLDHELKRILPILYPLMMHIAVARLTHQNSFYSWKSPVKTMSTLVVFSSCLALTLLADMDFCMKIFWFISGGTFFLCWPIASLCPQYRLLVSPFKWIFWDIPSHAEWSFDSLRRNCRKTREDVAGEKAQGESGIVKINPYYLGLVDGQTEFGSSDEEPSESSNYSSDDDEWYEASSCIVDVPELDLKTFHAHWNGRVGHLTINFIGLRFHQGHADVPLWVLPFSEFNEMSKFQLPGSRKNMLKKVFAKLNYLELKNMRGDVWSVRLGEKRDEAFNCIIGLSDLRWQALTTKCGKMKL